MTRTTQPEAWRLQVLNWGSAALASLTVLWALLRLTRPAPGAALEYYAGIAMFVGVAAWRSGPYSVRVAVMVATLFLLQALATISVGYTLGPVMLAITGVVAGGLLLGVRWAIAGWLLSAVIFLAVGILISEGTVASGFNPGSVDPHDMAVVLRVTLSYSAFSALLAVGVSVVVERLSESGRVLEERVAERTRDLQLSEERFRGVFETMHDAYIRAGLDGTILLANPRAAELLGYSSLKELYQANMGRDLYADPDTRLEIAGRILERGWLRGLEIQMKRKDGTTLLVESIVKVVYEDGEPVGFEGTLRDITARKEQERSLQESERRETLLKEVAIAAAAADGVDKAFVAALDSVCAFTGWPVGHVYVIAPDDPERLDPTTLWHIPSEQRFDVFKEVTERTPFVLGEGLPGRILSSRSPSWIVDVGKDPNFPRAKLADDLGVKGAFGFPVLIENELVAVLEFFSAEPQDPDKSLLEMVGQVGMQLGGSIARQQAVEALASAREAADAANRAKSRFLASMSHEIRTPMHAILGFSRLMDRDPSLPHQHRDRVQTMLRSGEHLLGLINDVLDMSKIEAGGLELVETTFDLHRTLKTLEAMFSVGTEPKALRVAVSRGEDVPQYVHTDQRKLQQILINLLGNAVKFTERGEVALRVARVEGTGSGFHLRFTVADTGPGISEEELGRVFEPFQQTQSGRAAQAGTGLGMPISRNFAQLMGGDLSVQSELGVGSTFTLQVVVQAARLSDLAGFRDRGRVTGLAPGHPTVTVLVVDDVATNRDVLGALLAEAGLMVEEAADGKEAVHQFQEVQPDLVFMDLKMPGLDGLEATRRIRETESGGSTPIVIVSASVVGEDMHSMLDTGASDFLAKPFKDDQIWEVLERLLGLEFSREVVEEVEVATEAVEFTPKAVSALGPELIGEIRAATAAVEFDRLQELLDQVATTDRALARSLRQLLNEYDYEALSELFALDDRES